MIRKQIYIESRQELLLKEIAHQTGTSEAEIIRQAIDRHICSTTLPRKSLEAWEAETDFIDKIYKRSSPPGSRDWTREALYER